MTRWSGEQPWKPGSRGAKFASFTPSVFFFHFKSCLRRHSQFWSETHLMIFEQLQLQEEMEISLGLWLGRNFSGADLQNLAQKRLTSYNRSRKYPICFVFVYTTGKDMKYSTILPWYIQSIPSPGVTMPFCYDLIARRLPGAGFQTGKEWPSIDPTRTWGLHMSSPMEIDDGWTMSLLLCIC